MHQKAAGGTHPHPFPLYPHRTHSLTEDIPSPTPLHLNFLYISPIRRILTQRSKGSPSSSLSSSFSNPRKRRGGGNSDHREANEEKRKKEERRAVWEGGYKREEKVGKTEEEKVDKSKEEKISKTKEDKEEETQEKIRVTKLR